MEQSIVNAISTVGFPIVMCGACAYFLYTIVNTLMGQMDKFTQSLDKFNNTLIGMDKRLESIEDKIK